MAKNKLLFLLLLVGLFTGVSFGLIKAKASNPNDDDVRAGEQPASVYYDEKWTAIGTTSGNGAWGTFIPKVASSPVTVTMAPIDYVKNFPKMVVTKWKVHGHIHFE